LTGHIVVFFGFPRLNPPGDGNGLSSGARMWAGLFA
jgi:hypothetical protein